MSDEDDHQHDEPLAPLPATPQHGYWKSLRELDGQAPWQVAPSLAEFPPEGDRPVDSSSLLGRRNFFHLMGASMGLAGVGAVSGCRRYESEEIVPLAHRPEDQVPGTTLQYATAYELGGAGHALLATSYEGRPIHLDGNPEHPFAGGPIVAGTKRHAGAHMFAQAAILHLYDPDRSQNFLKNGSEATYASFRAMLAELRGKLDGVHVLAEQSSSETIKRLSADLVANKKVTWHWYEPLSWDNEREGMKLAFGTAVRPLAHLEKCEQIVTIDCDLFVEHPAAMRYSRDFSRSRQRNGSWLGPDKMNRLWSVESIFTNTGAMADHRLPLRSELGLPFVMALDAALSGGAAPSARFLTDNKKTQQFLAALAEELAASKGRAVVIAGRRQPPEVHAIVAKINAALLAPGATLDYVDDPYPERPTHVQAITELAKAMKSGRVQALLVLGGNPAYDAPVDLDFEQSLKSVPLTVHLSEYYDETSRACTWHAPKTHFLEAWGDCRTWDGTITIAQPLIAPLYGGVSTPELLSLLLGDEKTGEELVAATFAAKGTWRQIVHDGYIPPEPRQAPQPALRTLPGVQLSPSQLAGTVRKNNELEVAFQYSSFTYDGRFANNAWLWETPDFLTKVVWDNYALVSPDTATDLGLKNDTMITVTVDKRSIDVPCYVMPGQAKYSIGLVLGGGRKYAGHVAMHPANVSNEWKPWAIGFDTFRVRASTGWDIATGCSVTATGKKYELANIQDHWDYRPGILQNTGVGKEAAGTDEISMRAKELIRETRNDVLVRSPSWKAEEEDEFWDDKEDAAVGKKQARHLSLFEEKAYAGHRWAMSIDLSTCTGCNACMVACQSENNVPVVGRREVINNREMSWIRIDRYFTGPPDDPRVAYQPIACQHCENAPCEQVCPVGATSHSDEGLNDMAYNRCIGTRYCANNCPYKVRRFNFLDWNKEFRDARAKVRRLLFNPDVTVRMRGVMEKCTFCVQRIQGAKIAWKAQHRNPTPSTVDRTGHSIGDPMPDGTIVTACQAACPTEAIVFGDLQDPDSRVSKLHADPRSYALLPETYTRPRNRFLAKVRNPSDKLEAARPEGHR